MKRTLLLLILPFVAALVLTLYFMDVFKPSPQAPVPETPTPPPAEKTDPTAPTLVTPGSAARRSKSPR